MTKKISTPDYKINDRVQERNKGPLGISNRDIRSENTRMLDARKSKQKFDNNRKGTILDIKKKLNNQYENLTNKFTSAKIKYL